MGDSHTEIATQLGVRPEFITWHLALLDAAPPIVAAFREARITGAKQIYRLNLLPEKAPQKMEAFLALASEITQRVIAQWHATIEGSPVKDSANKESLLRSPRPMRLPVGHALVRDRKSMCRKHRSPGGPMTHVREFGVEACLRYPCCSQNTPDGMSLCSCFCLHRARVGFW